MKAILITLISIVSIFPLQADPVKGVSDYGYMEPKAYFRNLLEIVAKNANKQVVVESEDVLKIQTSLVLPGPVSFENARKVIGALLMLEGYELVDKGDELHLQKILTKEQCVALNKALNRTRLDSSEPMPRQRVSGRAEQAPKQWVIVRPPDKPRGEPAAPSDGDKPSK